ncbi:MAG: hypothetical protein IT303_15700 [Dehalococcoidia bacterium]|nr:hypothetical protein [Dehalococcoidia bacterium]
MVIRTVGPADVAPEDTGDLARLGRLLARHPGGALLVGEDGEQVNLPPALAGLLVDAARALEHGGGVRLEELGVTVTVHEAAELLDLTPARVVELLDSGTLHAADSVHGPAIALADVLAYRPVWFAERRAILGDMVREAQEMGLYDL